MRPYRKQPPLSLPLKRIWGEGKTGVLLLGDVSSSGNFGAPSADRTGHFFERVVSRTPGPTAALDLRKDFWSLPNLQPSEIIAPPWLRAEVFRLKPKVVVAVGPIAWQAATGQNLLQLKSKRVGFEDVMLYTFQGEMGVPVLGVLAPHYLVKGNFHMTRTVQLGLLKAVEVAARGVPKWDTSGFQLYPTPVEAERFADDYERCLTDLAFDIETLYFGSEKDEDVWGDEEEEAEEGQADPTYTITRISFAFRGAGGEVRVLTQPWMEPYVSVARRLLASGGRKLVWNEAYDVPRLIANGAPVEGLIVDGMLGWKCIEPALPMGLKFVTSVLLPEVECWKLESQTQKELYSATDSDVLLRCWEKIVSRLEALNRWSMFEKHFIRCVKTLRSMTERGVRVDEQARTTGLAAVTQRMEAELAAIQPLIPREALKLKVFKHPLETLEKTWARTGKRPQNLLLVPRDLPSLKKGWELSGEGFLVRSPKPATSVKRRRGKSLSSESTSAESSGRAGTA